MVEIPEHLRKRAEEARAKAAAAQDDDAGADTGGDAEMTDEQKAAESRIPAHLLERSKAAAAKAEAKAEGGDTDSGGGTAVATKAPAAPAGTAPNGGPVPTGPDGHTQRLLTVVKSGSIQDVRATPQDKVHTWPHLLAIEFVAAVAVLAFLLIFSIFVNAPLEDWANPNLTPNPAKAPWYFLGLQELLTMFHPMVAGVTIPAIGLIGLMFGPYIDRNPSNKPEDRKLAIAIFTIFLMGAAVLTILSSFFRGPGFLFILPWTDGLFFEL